MTPGSGRLGVLAAVAVALAGCEGQGAEGGDCPSGVRQQTPSGYCVPRWLSLKRGEVFGRKGPGRDYPTVFVYHAKGLPVQVVDETADWRRICDPDGGQAWVASAMVDGRRMVMNAGREPLALRQGPSDQARTDAYLRARALAELGACRQGWCEVRASGAAGWVRAGEVWGLAPQPQCH
jgi:SH3-like domain-containing protein